MYHRDHKDHRDHVDESVYVTIAQDVLETRCLGAMPLIRILKS